MCIFWLKPRLGHPVLQLQRSTMADNDMGEWLAQAIRALNVAGLSGKALSRATAAALRESRLPVRYEYNQSKQPDANGKCSSDSHDDIAAEVADRLDCIEPVVKAQVEAAWLLEKPDIPHEKRIGCLKSGQEAAWSFGTF